MRHRLAAWSARHPGVSMEFLGACVGGVIAVGLIALAYAVAWLIGY